jgi:hypothetical protein
MFGNENNNNLQFNTILNHEAIVLESFIQIFWHGKHVFQKNCKFKKSLINPQPTNLGII